MKTSKGKRRPTTCSAKLKRQTERLMQKIKDELLVCQHFELWYCENIPRRGKSPRIGVLEHSPDLHKLLVELLEAVEDAEFIRLLRRECDMRMWRARAHLRSAMRHRPQVVAYRVRLADYKKRRRQVKSFLESRSRSKSSSLLRRAVDEHASELTREVAELVRKHGKRICHKELRNDGAAPEFVSMVLVALAMRPRDLDKLFAPVFDDPELPVLHPNS